MLIAVTRPVSASLARCQLTHVTRQPIDVPLAERQHAAYEDALRAAGCTVSRLAAEPDLPDAVFVEDMAVVLDEVAIVTRPGAESRRPEVASVAAALRSWRPIVAIQAPGTLDGGDVLRIGRRIFVGQSTRTNRSGFEQLAAAAGDFGYDAEWVPVTGCLHLKSAVTAIGPETVLVNPAWIASDVFERFGRLDVDPAEPGGANALLVGDRVIYPSAFPRTADRLRAAGVDLHVVDISEMAKAEGAVTCCSLIVSV